MKRFLAAIQAAAVAMGGPGLFLIAFLDSSFLSFPEVNDFMIVAAVMRDPHLAPYYAVMSTAGSVLGCLSIYYVARKGGEAFLRRRFKDHHVDGALALLQRYGLLTIVVPALLPPPAPFKIFVLLAGVAAIPVWQFVTAVAIARGIRYGGEALVAVWYGERTFAFLHEHAKPAGLALASAALVVGLVVVLVRRRRAR